MPTIASNILNNYPGVAIRFNPATGETLYVSGLYKDLILANLKTKDDIRISDLRSLIINEDQKKVTEITEENIQNQNNWNIEYRIEQNNNIYWLREQAQFNTSKKIPVIDLFIHDVTDFKIQNKKLKTDLTNANKSADLKNEFFASMSHEIRTPMNAVMGMAQILAKTQMDFEQKQYLGTIVNASHSLVQIINDILDVSKLDAGKIELINEETDLEKLCLDVCHLLTMHAEEKQIQLYLDYTPTNKNNVFTDSGRIRQILINLIGNALKFTKKGHVVLKVELTSVDNSQSYKFSVTDTGIGIPKDSQKHVFEAFSQADATISKQFGGTGLGLKICQKIVSLMNGEIGLESEPDKGSTFWFSLPLSHAKETLENKIDLSGKQCLLVDNDHKSLDIMSRILQQASATTTSVNESEDVLALLTSDERKFDYIIIDKNLTGLHGLKLASLIKKDKRYLDIPIILLTPISIKESKTQLFTSGINTYLKKPVSPSLLLNSLELSKNCKNQTEVTYVSNDNIRLDYKESKASFSGKALIVDDIEINQFILNALLSQLGLVADFANNGLEALDKLNNNNYDLIFMDCRMPIMDGYEATEKIRLLKNEKSKTPIIALTANTGERDKQECFDAGMDDFLSKPYTEKEVETILQTWIDKENIETSDISEDITGEFDNPVMDLQQFEAMKVTLDEEFTTFCTDLPDKFKAFHQDINNALIDGNMSIVHEKSQTLKGLSALIGATHVSELAMALERASNEKSLESANLALSKLDRAISEFQTFILENINPEMSDSVILF